MNGAKTDPLASTNKPPKINMTKIIGASQSFFRTLRKVNNSFKNIILNFPIKIDV